MIGDWDCVLKASEFPINFLAGEIIESNSSFSVAKSVVSVDALLDIFFDVGSTGSADKVSEVIAIASFVANFGDVVVAAALLFLFLAI